MGKVEILTLIAGIVLSIALALIVVPMFSKSEELIFKQKLSSEIIGLKNFIEINSKIIFIPNLDDNDAWENISYFSKYKTLLNEFEKKGYVKEGKLTSKVFDNQTFNIMMGNKSYSFYYTFENENYKKYWKDNANYFNKICDSEKIITFGNQFKCTINRQ